MRILFVWFTALTLMGFVTLAWYISQPIVVGVARAVSSNIPTEGMPHLVATFVEICNYIWGPLFDFIILGWAIISSQQRDVESELYG